MPRESYPLTLSLLSIAMTSMGLAAAASGLQWGAAPAGETLPLAWLYVHVMLRLAWLIVWPAVALRPASGPRTAEAVWWEAVAIASGALPAGIVAGFVSGASPNAVGLLLALQLTAAVLMAGFLRHQRHFPVIGAAGIGLIAALTLAGPVAAFLAAQFFPPNAAANWILFPLMAVGRAATGVTSPVDARLIWTLAAAQGLVGALLLVLARAKEKTPGTSVPRA